MNKGDIVKLHPMKYGNMSKEWGLGVITGWEDLEPTGWRTVTVRWMSEEIPPENKVDSHLSSDLLWVTSHGIG